MASLSEILQLDKTQASLKKIDLFLISQIKLSDEYLIAISYKALVLHEIGKSNDGLKLLFPFVPDFKILGPNGIIAVCDAIITIYIDEYRFDQVEKYINIKKNYLPMSKMNLYIKDRIKLFLAINDRDKAKNALLDYLNDDLTKEEEIFAKEELSNIYLNEYQYDKYLELSNSLEAYYQSNLSIDKLAKLDLNRFKIAYIKGNYIKVISDGNRFLESTSKPEYILLAAALVIKSYIMLNDLKKAGIFESNYEDYVSIDYPLESLEFCDAAIELYTKMNSLVSIKDYESRKKDIESKLTPQEKKKKKKNKEEIIVNNSEPKVIIRPSIIEEVVTPNISVLNPEPIDNKKTTIVSTRTTNVKNVLVSTAYNQLSNIFDSINELDDKIKFREVFRIAMINLCKSFPIEEAYVLYYKRSYLGLHYKKERAYDKRLSFDDVDGTLNYASMEYDDEEFLDQSQQDYKKNIVTGKDYEEDMYGIAIPIHDSLQTIGSISFISKESFLDKEMTYEAIKLIVSMLNSRLLLSLKQDEIEFNNKKLFFLRDKMSSGLKEEIDGYLHFSEQAMKILGVLEDLSEADYLLNMKPNDILEYKRIHEEIYTLLSENLELEYDYNKNGTWIRVKERYYPMYSDGIIYIFSLIDDISNEAKDKKDLIDLAYKNPISKLQTEVKLVIDLENHCQNGKMSLCITRINDFELYKDLYGYNFGKQLIY
ncbi:MAG: hypothetical protein IJA65_06005, partial [Acholeplasmatales bacterium]|nr:hypothetical protein [Acholeplasmatales bacterium]